MAFTTVNQALKAIGERFNVDAVPAIPRLPTTVQAEAWMTNGDAPALVINPEVSLGNLLAWCLDEVGRVESAAQVFWAASTTDQIETSPEDFYSVIVARLNAVTPVMHFAIDLLMKSEEAKSRPRV